MNVEAWKVWTKPAQSVKVYCAGLNVDARVQLILSHLTKSTVAKYLLTVDFLGQVAVRRMSWTCLPGYVRKTSVLGLV